MPPLSLEGFPASESFKEVVISVGEGDVHLAAFGEVPRAVLQEEAADFALFGKVWLVAQGFQRGKGLFAEALGERGILGQSR